jgi:hypothetical protein
MRNEVLGSISFEVLKATRCATAQMTATRLALRVWASLPSVETEDLLKRGRKQVKDWSELKEVLRLGLAFLTVSGVRALLSFFGILAPAAGTERTEELLQSAEFRPFPKPVPNDKVVLWERNWTLVNVWC